jgi:hypothetical protein
LSEFYVTYEEQSPGKGDRFLEAVNVSLNQLEKFPESGSIHFGSIRRILAFKREIGLFYRIENRGIIVHFLFHLRDDPAILERKLKSVTRGLT